MLKYFCFYQPTENNTPSSARLLSFQGNGGYLKPQMSNNKRDTRVEKYDFGQPEKNNF